MDIHQSFLSYISDFEDFHGCKPAFLEMTSEDVEILSKEAPARMINYYNKWFFYDIVVKIKE